MIDLPQLREGQTVRVFQRITEGKRERNVPFIGKVLKVRGSGVNQTITVMQMLEGIGVEKIFPTALPTITKIEVIEQVKSLTKGQPIIARRKTKRTKKTSKPRRAAKK